MKRLALAVLMFSCVAASADSVEVTFSGAGGFELKGTLSLPESAGKFPGILLLPGSGPTDRDGNQLPLLRTDLLKQLAESLTKEGLAVFRFDKRAAHVYAKSWPKGIPAQNTFFSLRNFVEDAKAAFEYLLNHPRVDSARTGILGHSEGGIISLQAVADGIRPSFIVLASTPGRSLLEVLTEQITAALKQQQVAPKESEYYLKTLGTIARDIIKTGELNYMPPPGLMALFPANAVKYLQSALSINPAKLARKVACPALVIIGEKDAQVSPERDAKPLIQALKSNSGIRTELVIISNASHNLKPLTRADSAGFAGPVSPDAILKLTAWIKSVVHTTDQQT